MADFFLMQNKIVTTPNGATVTPVDDYVIWLRCAELPNAYGSLANVIADSIAMEILCNNLNALRYMVRSTSTIMPEVLADNSWVSALDGSTYASKVPTLTTYVGSNGVASASSEYSGQPAWHIFDKNDSTTWATAYKGGSGHWVKYVFTDAINLYKFTHNLYKYTFKIQYSDDDTSWFDATSNITDNGDTTTKTVKVSNLSGSHRYWRLYVVTGSSGFNNSRELDFYGLDLS